MKAERKHGRAAGFTLIELLLAMSVSALVAVLAYTGLTSVITTSQSMQDEVRRLSAVQQTLGMLEEDLLQVRPRAITNGYGIQEAAFRGGAFQDVLLEFTRGGLGNPANLARSELQRVRYVFADGGLWRQSWPVVDRADENQRPDTVQLLDGLDAAQIQFLGADAGGSAIFDFSGLSSGAVYWDDDWHSQQLAEDVTEPLPVAVTVTLSISEFGEVRRVFALP